MTTSEIIELIMKTHGVEGLKELATQAAETAKSLAEVGDAAEKVEKKTLDLESLKTQGGGLVSLLTGGNAAEKIPQIISQVGNLVEFIPVVGQWATYIKKAGSVAETAWPFLQNLYQQWSESEAIGKKAIKTVEDYGNRLDEFGESLSNLTDRTITFNKEWKVAQEGLDPKEFHSKEAMNADAAKKAEAAKTAKELQDRFGGKRGDVIEAVALAMAGEEERSVNAKLSTIGDGKPFSQMTPEESAEYLEAARRSAALQKGIPKDIQQKAMEKTASAVMGGDQDAIEEIYESLPDKGRGSQFKPGFGAQTAKGKQTAKEVADELDATSRQNKLQVATNKNSAEANEEASHWHAKFDAEKAAKEDAKAAQADKSWQEGLKEAKALEARQAAEATARKSVRQIQIQAAANGEDINQGEAMRRYLESEKKKNSARKQLDDVLEAATIANARETTDIKKKVGNVRQEVQRGRTAQNNGIN